MEAHVRVAHARATEAKAIARELVEQLGAPRPELVVFFASSRLPFDDIARALQEAFGDTLTTGCTTCGEIGPEGCTVGRVSAIAFSAPTRAAAHVLPRADAFRFAEGTELVDALVRELGHDGATLARRPGDFALVTLSDGLAGSEEILLAALHDAAPGIALVGGSSADDFAFEATAVAHRGRAYWGGSIAILLEPGTPFHPFHLHHFSPAEEAIVITAAEPLERLVSRINGYPAVPWLARRLQFDEAQLRARPAEVLNQRPVVFGTRSGGATFMRSVMSVLDDALLMGGALEEGAIVHLMNGADIIEATRRGMETAIEVLPTADTCLLFNCGGRMWEANALGKVADLAEAMSPLPAAGFTTYGEQFGTMQINHTLTGLVFGRKHG